MPYPQGDVIRVVEGEMVPADGFLLASLESLFECEGKTLSAVINTFEETRWPAENKSVSVIFF
jgi:hypothetical protein